MASSQQDIINRLKRDLKLTKERCEDLANELNIKETQLMEMEAVTFFLALKENQPLSRTETPSEQSFSMETASSRRWRQLSL